GVGSDFIDEPVAVANALGGNQGAFGVQAVENVLEAFAFLANQVLFGNFQVVEEQFVGFMVDHIGNGANLHAFADGLMQVDDEDRHAFRLLLHLVERGGAGQQYHQVGVLDAGDPDL